MFRFDTPFAFLLLILIPLIVFFSYRKKFKAGLRFSSTKNVNKMPVSLRQRLSIIPLLVRILALVFFVLAIARPQEGKEMIRDMSRGVAIEMVIDRSSSMSLLKDFGNRTYSRLDIAKTAFSEFVNGNNNGLKGRPNDLIGMISFARYSDTMCPLTLSHGALLKFNENLNTVIPGSNEDGTSIGDGIALAAARLKTAEATIAEQLEKEESDYQIKSKIIILLTDGEDTGIGKRTPLEAAGIAKEWGIKIYTIGISGKGWYQNQETILGKRKVPARSSFNTSELKKIAEDTGGIARIAGDIESLRDIYKEIDALEKSEIESIRFLDYKELFVPFALIGLLFLAVEIFLSSTLFRRIP